MSNIPYVLLEEFKPTAGDGTDDTAAWMSARAASFARRVPVQFLGKTYNFDYIVDMNDHGIQVQGVGKGLRFVNPRNYGTILNSRVTAGLAFDIGGQASIIQDIDFTAVTTGIAVSSDLRGFASMTNCGVHTNNAAVGLRLGDAYAMQYENIDVVNTSQNRQGIGVWHDSTTAILAGGLLRLVNVTANYYDTNISLGQKSETISQAQFPRVANELICCQGRYGNTNLLIGSGYKTVLVTNFWGEGSTNAALGSDIHIVQGAGPVEFIGGFLSSVDRHGITIGDKYNVETVKTTPVTVRNMGFWPNAGFSAVNIYPNKGTSTALNPYHLFDNCTFTSRGGKVLTSERTTQMPVKITRPEFIDYAYTAASQCAFDQLGAAYPEIVTT